MNEHQKVSCFNNTHRFPLTLIYSPVWLVCRTKWQDLCYDWSDRLSVKLVAKGELIFISVKKCVFMVLVNSNNPDVIIQEICNNHRHE